MVLATYGQVRVYTLIHTLIYLWAGEGIHSHTHTHILMGR
jgi:hypothetical protein